VISWGTIFYGAALSTVITAAVVIAVKRWRTPRILLATLAAAFLGPLAWNAILRRAATPGDTFFVDIPFKPFPVSWQDTGSGVFTLAAASLFLGIALPSEPAGRVTAIAVLAASIAFVVDIYFY
jgi:hypothetical protein